MDSRDRNDCFTRVQRHAQVIFSDRHPQLLPDLSTLRAASASLVSELPFDGKGIDAITEHLLSDISPGLNASSLSPNYYGFVTGGVTPAAWIADNLVTLYDQNVHVHLPDQTIATVVEDRALRLLLQLLNFKPEEWKGRTFTTGATGSNVLGLTLGREYVIRQALRKAKGRDDIEDAVGELGILEACQTAGVRRIQTLSTLPHSSLKKAAGITGLGRASVHDVGRGDESLVFDMEKLESMLQRVGHASIVAISCGEVNTGGFATHTAGEVRKIRELCDRYGAWMHVDGAFGIFARTLEGPEYERVISGARCLGLADSIAGDAHKLLNVPYDCGFFFTKHSHISQQVFKNPNAAYLDTGDESGGTIESPLNVGMENSRRFRGLPVYATLVAYGLSGYRDMLERQVGLARSIARYIHSSTKFELLPENLRDIPKFEEEIYIIVLFKARDTMSNRSLVQKINSTSKMYVSGTTWRGEPACRIAVSNWQVNMERDLEVVKTVLEGIVADKA